MRIGIKISPLWGAMTGIPNYILQLLRSMSKIDRDDEFFLYTNRPIPFELGLGDNFRTVLVNKPYPRWQLWYQIGLPRQIRRDRIQLYHDPVYLLPFRLGVPGIITIHDLSGLVMPHFHRKKVAMTSKLIPYSVRKAKRIIAVSEFTKSEIVRLFPAAEDKITVIYEAASDDFVPVTDINRLNLVRRKYRLPEKFVLFVGTLEPRKNLVGIMKAYARIRAEIPHSLVVVGGRGWKYSNIYKLLSSLNIEENVIFTGFVDASDMPAIYSMADIFAYPSFYEGFGLPVLEAMACGTPVLTSNTSSLPEVAGDAAILVNPNSVDDISEKLLMLAKNEDIRKDLSRRGIENARMFSWEKAARETIDLYHNVGGNYGIE